MVLHPAWAIGRYSSSPPELSQREVFTDQNGHPVGLTASKICNPGTSAVLLDRDEGPDGSPLRAGGVDGIVANPGERGDAHHRLPSDR